MDDINYILGDASKNDKQMVKELSIFIKNHSNKNLPINKKFVIGICDIIFRNSEIDYSEVCFNDKIKRAAYDRNDKKISINILGIINGEKIMNAAYYKFQDDNLKITLYFGILYSLIHEVTHAKQYEIMRNNKNVIYTLCDELIQKNYNAYLNNHHDLLLIERYAYLRGYILAFQVLSYVFPVEQINVFQMLVAANLLLGYKKKDNGEIVSAIENFNIILEENGLEKIYIEYGDDMSLYNRLYLGLPISIEEYDKVFDLGYDVFISKTKHGEFKELVKKL